MRSPKKKRSRRNKSTKSDRIKRRISSKKLTDGGKSKHGLIRQHKREHVSTHNNTSSGLKEHKPEDAKFSFYKYLDVLFSDSYASYSQEPGIIEEENVYIYVIGDLEGDSNILVRWLLDISFIMFDDDDEIKWIADDNVYIVQCGDQLDNGYGHTEKAKTFPFLNRRTEFDVEYFNHDLNLILLTDYLSIISNNRFLSILGNHEILNIMGDYRYVNLSNFLTDFEKDNVKLFYEGFNLITNRRRTGKKYNSEFLGPKIEKITNYMIERRKALTKQGIIGKILSRRNFIIKINTLILSHAGLTYEYIDETQSIENIIKNTNIQITIDNNWANIPEYNKFEFSNMYELVDSESSFVVDGNKFTDIFKTIITQNQKSLIWNRIYNPKDLSSPSLSNIDKLYDYLRKSDPDKYFIIALGHNGMDMSTKFCKCEPVCKCDSTYTKGKNIQFVMTDVGRGNINYPYIEATMFHFNDVNSPNDVVTYKFPTIDNKEKDNHIDDTTFLSSFRDNKPINTFFSDNIQKYVKSSKKMNLLTLFNIDL